MKKTKYFDFVYIFFKPIYLKKILFLFIVINLSCGSDNDQKKYNIHQGEFKASIIETGELQAVKAHSVIVPDFRRYGRLLITELIEHGKVVKKGDLVAKLDPSNVMNYITDQQTELDVEKTNLNKLYAQMNSKKESLDGELKTVQANYNMKKLELEKFQFESETKKKIKELEFEQAKIRLKNTERKIELENKISKNEIFIQTIKVRQREQNIQNAIQAKEKLHLYAGADGIAQVMIGPRTRQMLKVGDQVWRGLCIVSIPDVNNMQVNAKINETDIGKIKLGQEVIIRLDAYPAKPFEGKVSKIGKLSYPKDKNSKVKVFDIEILIDGSDETLKPGMTVSCEFLYANMDNAFYVPSDCVEKNGSGYYLYVKKGNNYEKQKIKIGPQNSLFTVLEGNFRKGTEVIPVSEVKREIKN